MSSINPDLFGLAPMEGVTDLATRLWISLASRPPFMTTPFLRVTENFPSKRISKVFAPELIAPREATSYLLTPQLMASEADEFTRIAEYFLKFCPAVELNCGCPSPTVIHGGAGSSLLRSLDVFGDFISLIAGRLGADKFHVKMRTGFNDAAEFPALLERIRSERIAQLTVHGRTRVDRYTGRARWDLISDAANTCDFPVVGSGDICDMGSANLAATKAVKASRFIIGRGALRNPWVFEELRRGHTLDLSLATLKIALLTFTVLQDAQHNQEEELLQGLFEGDFSEYCGTNEESWLRKFEGLTHTIYKKHQSPSSYIASAQINPQVLSRLKMIWHHLRTSLPAPYFEPTILRSKSLSEFFTAISLPIQHFALGYNDLHSWIFSGERRPNQA